MNKKVPMRKCVGCGESKPKQELIRIVASEDGVSADPTGRKNGRGCYLCKGSEECFKTARKRNAIGRNLQVELTDEMLDALYEELVK
ncbi:MAG: YlxR family protein [Firmicutes bacterium]|nr:YlxR family protein [Bacillota bacterium]MBQ9972581.1 YlxR family protein [Bacillota bacterium]